jgi:uncharacterized small protein (TIGR04563 family)
VSAPKDLRGGSASTKKKVTLYFNAPMLAETQKEAIRQDRSISWIIQAAWRKAKDEVRRLPAVGRIEDSGNADDTGQTTNDSD